MTRIAIVGGGQAGMPLALGLLDKGYDVTVATNRKPDEVRRPGPCPASASSTRRCGSSATWASTNGTMPVRRSRGLRRAAASGTGRRQGHRLGRALDRPAQAVDQRLKMPVWLEARPRRQSADPGRGRGRAGSAGAKPRPGHPAAGRRWSRFERDAARSRFDKPQRALALTYVHGLAPSPDFSRVSFNLVPGVGEYLCSPR